jgi:hypothetical protein
MPNRFKLGNSLGGRIRSKISGIYRPDRGADQQIRLYTLFRQGFEHTNLDSAEATAPGKDKRGLRN